MKLLEMIAGRSKSKRASQREPSPSRGKPAAVPVSGTRQELLLMAVRDVVKRHGLPSGWMQLETMSGSGRTGRPGIYLRIVLLEWHPRLAVALVAMQRSIVERLNRLDPLAKEWMLGVSWKLAPRDEGRCEPLPEPAFWKSFSATTSQDSSPGEERDGRRSALERMFSAADLAIHDRRSQGHQDFSPTQPMFGGDYR